MSGQSLILNDTLTLLHYSGVILITKGFNCLSIFGSLPTPAIGNVEIGVNIYNLSP